MVCSNIKKLQNYITVNKLGVTSFDLVHVVCTKCKTKEDCISIK